MDSRRPLLVVPEKLFRFEIVPSTEARFSRIFGPFPPDPFFLDKATSEHDFPLLSEKAMSY